MEFAVKLIFKMSVSILHLENTKILKNLPKSFRVFHMIWLLVYRKKNSYMFES